MIKIFLESDKFSHKAGVTKHATNSLARKSHNLQSITWSPKCAAITGVGVDMSPHCFIKGPNGSASYTASGSKV